MTHWAEARLVPCSVAFDPTWQVKARINRITRGIRLTAD